MNETIEIKIQERRSVVQDLVQQINRAAKQASEANSNVVQLAWDLGDQLQNAKKESPENFEAFLEGLFISKDVAKAWMKVRSLAESKEDLKGANETRQAMLAMVVPGKESTDEERIELAPPQTFYQWVNKSNSWLKKLEVGLVKFQEDQLKSATEKLYSFLKKIHE